MLVICDGMIRAGSTLQYNVARRLAEILGVGIGESELKKRLDGSSHITDPELFALAIDRTTYVIKIHNLKEWIYPRAFEIVPAASIRVCTIYRDLRDVAVSARRKWRYTFDELLELLDEQMRDARDLDSLPVQVPVLSQYYETVMRDLPAAVRQIAAFLDLTPTDEIVRQIADECSVEVALQTMTTVQERLRVAVHTIGKKNSVAAHRLLTLARNGKLNFLDETTLIHYNHISRTLGASGVWKTDLKHEDARVITQRYWNWLVEKGYESEASYEFWHASASVPVAV